VATVPVDTQSSALSGEHEFVRDAYLPYQVIQRQPMHSLFLKILLWFWLSAILISFDHGHHSGIKASDCEGSHLKPSGQMSGARRLRRLRRAELPVDTVALARYLIGKVVVHERDSGRLSGRIVETEAYPIRDAAGHAFRGRTARNSSLFLERGHAYVYFTYGSSFLLNVTSEVAGAGGGVLLRAIEPLDGIERMAESLGTTRLADLGRGPGRLTRAIQVDLRQDGIDLCAAGPLWLAATAKRTGAIGKSVRIGLTRNVNRLLRFYERGNPHVSGPKKLRQ